MSHNCLSNEEVELEGLVNDISISDSSGSLSAVEDSRSVWPSRCRFCFFHGKAGNDNSRILGLSPGGTDTGRN